MQKLNLPEFNYQIKQSEGKLWIFDVIRKKYLVLLPEEWVRQHFIHYLLSHARYPKSLIKVEGGLKYNELGKRSDIVIWNRNGEPWMLVECKAPDIEITEATMMQASTYNATLRAKYLTVTNGMRHYCALIDWDHRTTQLLSGLPEYEQ